MGFKRANVLSGYFRI